MSDLSWAEPPRLKMPIGFHTLYLKLNILTVEWSSEDPNINLFFSSITLPSLRTLDVHFDHQDIDRPELAYIMIRFFKRSCTRLRSLKLTKIPFPQSVLIECLASSPSLVSLDIGFDGIWNLLGKKLLDELNLDHDHPGYVFLHLRSLAFRGQADALIEGPMNALIASRRYIDPECDGITMLENLTLECKFDLIGDPPRLHQFASEGLNITYGKDWQR
ncbi:hypothetical protein BD779DRAFT_510740 [Infundibulicybe gibba]|nr:hypothetical protein BD779DRAFT_510740 [Infundibulicybe gibba]